MAEVADAPPKEQEEAGGASGELDDAPMMSMASTPPPVEEGAPLWMATFGDMMSLLLVFFILLFSMSELQMDRFLIASQSLREAVGGTAPEPIVDPMGLMPDPVDPELEMQNPGMTDGATEANTTGEGDVAKLQLPVDEILADEVLDDIVDEIMEFIERYSLEETLLVERDDSGVRIRVQASALFLSGVGSIQPGSEWIVEFIGDLTDEIPIPIVVTGHADNQPIRSARYASNWELSAVRAAGIARLLAEHGHDATGIKVEARGEFEPVADNATPEGRALNRRVEFFYNRKDIIDAVSAWRGSLAGVTEATEATSAAESGDPTR